MTLPVDDAPPVAPELTVENCVSVLVSSDFLRMDRLTEECLDFVTANAVAVARGPLNLGALAERLLRRLAARLDEDTVEALRDANDAGRRSRPNCTVSNSSGSSSRERRPRRDASRAVPYDAAHRSNLACSRARVYVDFHGDVVARHVPSRRFDLARTFDASSTAGTISATSTGTSGARSTSFLGVRRVARTRPHQSWVSACTTPPHRRSTEGTTREPTGVMRASASIRRRRPRAREEDVARENTSPRPPRGGAYSPDSEAWEAARWILSATRRRALIVEPHGFGPATIATRPCRARRRDAPPRRGCVNGVYLARDHHALAFADEDEERRRTLVFDGDFAKSEAPRAGADEDEDTAGSSDGDGWGGVGVWAPAPPMRAMFADAGRGSDANARTRACTDASRTSSTSSSATSSSSDGASTDDEFAARAARRKKPSASGFPALTKIAPRGVTPQRMGRRAAAAAAGTGRVSWAKTGVANTKNAPASAGKLSRRKKNAHAGKSRSIEPSAYGLPRETYEALPEHLKRSIRRDAR